MNDKVISKKIDPKDYDLTTIAGRVRWKREKLGMKSYELAAACEVPPTSINMLEMGKVRQPRYLTKLADKLKTSADYLLYGDSEETTIRISNDQTLLCVDQDIRPDFNNYDYYAVKVPKGSKPFYPSDMSQVGEISRIFVGHKKE